MRLTRNMIYKFGAIADIGAQNASDYLSIMTKKKVKVNIPWVSSYPYEKISNTIGKPNELITAIFMHLDGDLHGVILMLFPEKNAIEMSDLLQRKTGSQKLDELGKSALMEAGGNILANAYLNAFAEKLNVKIQDSIPHIATDMLAALLDGILGTFGAKSEEALIFKNNFNVASKKVRGYSLILFDPDSFNILLEKLRKCKIK